MDDMSYFKTLTIETNAPGYDDAEWDKQEVLLELNELSLSHVYSGITDWAKYIIDRVLDDVEDYDEPLVDAFLKSKFATELTLKVKLGPNEVGEFKIYKS